MQSLTHSASVYWVLCARHGIRNIRKQKGDLRPQENDSLILVYLGGLYYESQKQLKTKGKISLHRTYVLWKLEARGFQEVLRGEMYYQWRMDGIKCGGGSLFQEGHGLNAG